MQDNHFKALILCIVGSILSLIFFTYSDFSPFVNMMAAVGPLIYYHFFYLYPKAKNGLSQAAIDSVYYYGFLVTVTALAISAITIANTNSGSLNLVIYQFGIGLLATGYAVIARMHLSSISSTLDEVNQEILLKNYIQKSLDLVSQIDLASSSLSSFATNIMQKTELVSQKSLEISQRAMIDVAKIFEQEMKSSLAISKEGLIEVRNLVKDTTFLTERTELQNSIKQTVNCTQVLNNSFENLNKRIQAGSESLNANLNLFRTLNETFSGLSTTLIEFSNENGSIKKASLALQESALALESGSKSIDANIQAFDELSKALNNSIKSVTDEAKDLSLKTSKFKIPTQRLLEILDASSKLDSKLDVLGENFESFGKKIISAQNQIENSTASLKSSIEASNAALEADVVKSSKAATQLTNQLINLTQEIISSTNKVQGTIN